VAGCRSLYFETIRGERRGLLAAALRAALAVAAIAYGLAVALRRALYGLGVLRPRRLPVPVLSVGNITAGGTGKTPLVEDIARRLLGRGRRVAIVARGYGARAGGPNDESLVLAGNLPHVPQVLDPDRVRGGRTAIERHRADCLLLDDAFQHRRIARDLDIVLVDATNPFGYGRLLPRGLLREPAAALRRAGAIVLTRADLVAEDRLAALRLEIGRLAPGVPLAEAVEEPLGLARLEDGGPPLPPSWLAGRPVIAFAGIGNPAGFFARLERLGARLVGREVFPDHHPYERGEIERLLLAAQAAGAEALVCTQKDAVKIRPPASGPPIYCLRIRVAIRSGAAALEAAIDGGIAGS
jgi:tetraacyldisaccharide 4'-kinase